MDRNKNTLHYFMGSEEFMWKIDEESQPSISTLLSTRVGSKYCSSIFELCKLNWMIELYPNGYREDSRGAFKLYVQLLSMPDKACKNIIVCRTIECLESMTKITNICQYKNDESYGWTTGSLYLQEIKENNYKSLTFIITIRILQINYSNDTQSAVINPILCHNIYKKQYKLKWKLTGSIFS